jgi:hypothetical protein
MNTRLDPDAKAITLMVVLCAIVWDYENDKNNTHAGWSVVGQLDADR